MNKKFLIFVLVIAALVFVAFFSRSRFQTTQTPAISPTPPINLRNAMLVIDYGENNPTNYSSEITESSTAFSLLKDIAERENINLVTQQYDFGEFVKSINGKESTTEMTWIYYVNGESGTVAADQIKINPGDTVEWKYIPPTEE
jgi:hypothetical protein